ncbi:hypothetical protein GCM10023163_02600 [Aestuariibaculum suncheonense]
MIYGVTPEELNETVQKGIEARLDDLKEYFQPKTPEELLTKKETCELLKIKLTCLHNWAENGILKKYGLGGKVYFKRSEIESALVELKSAKA